MNILIRAGVNHIVYVHHKFRKHWLVESCSLGDQDKLKLKESKNEESSNEDFALLSQSLETLGSYTKIKLKIMPWARIDGTLNLKVFEKWMSTILGHCLSNQMIPIKKLINKFCYLKPVDVYYLVECLQEMGCVQMLTYKLENCSIFSTPTYRCPIPASVTDDFEDVFIETDRFAVIKLGTLFNKKLKEFDFPSDEAKKHGTF
ncbi:hypothetical protein ILUMI_11254 [Ignelater luminosus]|uniref:Uncharacterized protein n=1 Tax=Ignelater luminosus TaxID=2038154 RepID=A0A8K0CWE5_IGNLU|nr:hypothetical protein ILUMI_11254 [Ignelater luminosus]